MRQFYESISVNTETLRFCSKCENCGKLEFGTRIPLLCRNVRTLARCEKGKANKLCQSLYNHAKANSTQLIAMKMNRCRRCNKWVCDDCYDNEDPFGVCSECSKTNRK